ncbi:MAG: hypothetical protein HUJ25_10495 [Crocinitomicaceae bacterium]|nr:hypothetical protein [Crocinitomicaceae bacterium]
MDNEALREEIFNIIDNQIADNDPKETKETLEKLISMGLDEQSAKELIAKCLSIELMDVIENGATYNHQRYVSNLKRLPMEPE